jgi:Family of unknown function (DUF6461)
MPDWEWAQEGDLEIMGSLTFVRGATPEQIIVAYGMDPAAARMLPAARASEVIRLPAWDDSLDVIRPWIRAGRTGEWAFGVDDGNTAGLPGAGEIVSGLSRGTDAVWFTWNPKPVDDFQYLVDGVKVTEFEPLMSPWRYGTEPDRFVPWMRQAGLDVDPPPDNAELTGDPRIQLLEMLTLALGIRLSREVALGPLLTVQRGA